MAAEEAIIHVLISLAILLFAAKIFAEVFNKLKLPAVLGELIAGIIVGPFALGSIPIFDGQPVVILNETVLQIGQIAGIVILFIAGLHITPREFLKGGAASFTIGATCSPMFVYKGRWKRFACNCSRWNTSTCYGTTWILHGIHN